MEVFFLMLASALSAMLTFLLHDKYEQGIVRSSAIVGGLVGVFVLLLPDFCSPYLTIHLPLVCFGASFIGMVSSRVLNNYWALSLAGVIFTLLYLNTSTLFEGFGGTLGATACIALLIVLAFMEVLKLSIKGRSKE